MIKRKIISTIIFLLMAARSTFLAFTRNLSDLKKTIKLYKYSITVMISMAFTILLWIFIDIYAYPTSMQSLPETHISPIEQIIKYRRKNNTNRENLAVGQHYVKQGKGIITATQGKAVTKIEFRKNGKLLNPLVTVGPDKNTTDYFVPCPAIKEGTVTIAWSVRKVGSNKCGSSLTVYVNTTYKKNDVKNNYSHPQKLEKLSSSEKALFQSLNISPAEDNTLALVSLDLGKLVIDVRRGAVNIDKIDKIDNPKLQNRYKNVTTKSNLAKKIISLERSSLPNSFSQLLSQTVKANERFTYGNETGGAINPSPNNVSSSPSIIKFLEDEGWSPDAQQVISDFRSAPVQSSNSSQGSVPSTNNSAHSRLKCNT